MRILATASLAALALGALPAAAAPGDGLLFRASLDHDFHAETAGGDPVPNFRSDVSIVPDGAIGGAARWEDDGYVAWKAPGNMLAARGTLSFFWRSRYPVGEAPFVIFRAGFADHTSWDMTFLRIDWNGHGFDAFVTDASLSRIRVSWAMPQKPSPSVWNHIAFAWDETVGVRLYVDGHEVAAKDQKADLDNGLDGFGMAGRVLSPHQVQSRYNFMRGSDLDEIRVYDHMLPAAAIATLAAKGEPAADKGSDKSAAWAAWLHRYGWDKGLPPVLEPGTTTIRKVEFADARDMKERMWKGVDGIDETTWPGVYNRSRLPGRDDYFELPDWNVYVEGGKRYELTVPTGEPFNRVEIRGGAYGSLTWAGDSGKSQLLAQRPQGVVRSADSFATRQGGVLSFTNIMQEQPIQEIWAYDVTQAPEPNGSFKLDYVIDAKTSPDMAPLSALNSFIAGRYPLDERTTVVAMPSSGVKAAVGAGAAGAGGGNAVIAGAAPIVHVLIPSSFGEAKADQPLARAWDYGWQNLHDGLDGIAIDLPALNVTPRPGGLVALNIRVKDPIWPMRDMIDVSVSVPPGQKRTLWLDLRDRILSNDSLYLSIAASAPDFTAASLNGAHIRLVFKPRAQALREHVADRLMQVKDNWSYLVEEHTASMREGLYRRLHGDVTDLLRVDPDNAEARAWWADIDYRPENLPPVSLPPVPAGVPGWAARQLQDLALVRHFVNWWIDERQVPFGDFGGGISDDTDLVQQWPGVALMGVEPDKINASVRALSDAAYKNGMIVNGLPYITTDELHVYEEGINSNGERLYLNWGEPKAVERLMATTKALQSVIMVNPAGHMHFASNWYGARKMYREGPWEWQKPYSFSVTQSPILVGLYNGNATARGLVTGLMDGLLAHGKQGSDGLWRFPNDINWRSDAERAGDGGGASLPPQAAWAAWRFTGDARYLRPIDTLIAKGGFGALHQFDDNGFALLPDGAALLAKVPAKPTTGFGHYAAWLKTGDRKEIETLHEEAIIDKTQHMGMMTQGHWWTDRVEIASDMLQRERLGGIALVRGNYWPGNLVSWRFAEPEGAEKVALLVSNDRADHFRVTAYNSSEKDQAATMSTWDIPAGSWIMRGDDGSEQHVTLERSASIALRFAPGRETTLDFRLAKAEAPVEQRPDLGIGADDVQVARGAVAVTVHSLGAKPAEGGVAMLVAADGRVLAKVTIPTLPAPSDLTPKTTSLRLPLPAGGAAQGLTVRVSLPDSVQEITQLNNSIPVPAGR
ncbi:MAG: LamG domain-containing protein [Sphingomonadales bacterium]|nr:LamG domain-containing protein [Sphingomonadales bacterium]MDE2168389.1 LamG domain-containing protein [Sphingomonadales bacterium]